MTRTLLLLCILGTLATAQAADLNPPDWRGDPGSTYQQWDFQFATGSDGKTTIAECSQVDFIVNEEGGQATPDRVVNPYEQTTGICVEFKSLWFVTKRLDWLQEYIGKVGVWKLQSNPTFENFLNFIIPNAETNENTTTIIQLQFLFYSLRGVPSVTVYYPADRELSAKSLEVFRKSPDMTLPRNWTHSTYTYKSAGCPRYESIFINPPQRGDIYLDSVIIDTICTETPDTYLSP